GRWRGGGRRSDGGWSRDRLTERLEQRRWTCLDWGRLRRNGGCEGRIIGGRAHEEGRPLGRSRWYCAQNDRARGTGHGRSGEFQQIAAALVAAPTPCLPSPGGRGKSRRAFQFFQASLERFDLSGECYNFI